MLETNDTLNLRQLLKILLELKRYLWQEMKLDKPQNVAKAITKKTIPSIIQEVTTINVVMITIWWLFKCRLGKILQKMFCQMVDLEITSFQKIKIEAGVAKA